MQLTNHASRRLRERIGIKNRRRQQSWVHRRMNSGEWQKMPDGSARICSGRWRIVFDRGRIVTIWESE